MTRGEKQKVITYFQYVGVICDCKRSSQITFYLSNLFSFVICENRLAIQLRNNRLVIRLDSTTIEFIHTTVVKLQPYLSFTVTISTSRKFWFVSFFYLHPDTDPTVLLLPGLLPSCPSSWSQCCLIRRSSRSIHSLGTLRYRCHLIPYLTRNDTIWTLQMWIFDCFSVVRRISILYQDIALAYFKVGMSPLQ